MAPEVGSLKVDPPWPCEYTHRGQIHLGALWLDLRNAANRYSEDVAKDHQLQRRFEDCMRQLYPTGRDV